jgi:hypothetical protein
LRLLNINFSCLHQTFMKTSSAACEMLSSFEFPTAFSKRFRLSRSWALLEWRRPSGSHLPKGKIFPSNFG